MSGFIKGTGNIMVSKSVSAFKELTIQKGEKNIKKKKQLFIQEQWHYTERVCRQIRETSVHRKAKGCRGL